MFGSFVSRLKNIAFFWLAKRKPRTHDYTKYVWGENYVFEPLEEGNGGYMTGYGTGIKQGDYLILSNGTDSAKYRVDAIDYYSNPPDMWIALLKKV